MSPTPAAENPDAVSRCREMLSRFPAGGLFAGHEWRCAPEPFALAPHVLDLIGRMGAALHAFNQACNRLYLASAEGHMPPWIAAWLDAGKPAELVAFARSRHLRQSLPAVIRPDFLLTDDGLCLCELDSVPGGIGATAWLQESYAALGFDVAAGPAGMRTHWRRILPAGDVVISREAAAYKPEMQWLNAGTAVEVLDAEPYHARGRPIYRFFEAFDLPNLPHAPEWCAAVRDGLPMTPPLKPFLEEKLWLALFWLPSLQSWWREHIPGKFLDPLRAVIPYGWVLSPEPLPPHAAIPRLDIHDWAEAAAFSQKRRRLVLKISGFSEHAWGSRGVVFGHDVPHDEWRAALHDALAAFHTHPRVLQEFRPGRLVDTRFLGDDGAIAPMRARARLCPYYFVAGEAPPVLGGILATLCPSDKKAIHGMRDAIMTTVMPAPAPD